MGKRILFCTIGSTPQVVTETVWALRRDGWTPDEIHVVTTTYALAFIRKELQAPAGHLRQMFSATAPPVTVHLPLADGALLSLAAGDPDDPAQLAAALPDVNSAEQAEAMWTAIDTLMQRFVADGESEVHVSLAGGRKTMSAHALLAMTVHGRIQDRLSHVLVNPPEIYEDNGDFWHPDQGGGLIHARGERFKAPRPEPSHDPSGAQVALVYTHTPLLRYEVENYDPFHKRPPARRIQDYNLVNKFARDPSVALDPSSNVVIVAGAAFRFTALNFAMFRTLFEARRNAWTAGASAKEVGWLTHHALAEGRDADGARIAEIHGRHLEDAILAAKGALGLDEEQKDAAGRWRKEVIEQPDAEERLRNAKSNFVFVRFRDFLAKTLGAPLSEALVGEVQTKGRKDPAEKTRIGLRAPRNALSGR